MPSQLEIKNGASRNPEVQRHAAVVRKLEPKIAHMLAGERYLLANERLWQPADFLPDFKQSDGIDKLKSLQEGAKRLTLPTLISVTGNTITEDAVSTYQTWNNRPQGTQDETGTDSHAWADWSRRWTKEEYRHHLVLNRYLYLSGRVNVRALDISGESLIANGFDPKTGDDPYKFVVFTAIQERATWIAHRNTGKLAEKEGAQELADICEAVSLDEKRHERFYADVMTEILKVDPTDALIALDELDQAGILMPAAYMTDGESIGSESKSSALYDQYARIAHLAGVYTTKDFREVMNHFLFDKWNIKDLDFPQGQTPEEVERVNQAKEAQARLVAKYTRRTPEEANEIVSKRLARDGVVFDFSWVRDDAA